MKELVIDIPVLVMKINCTTVQLLFRHTCNILMIGTS